MGMGKIKCPNCLAEVSGEKKKDGFVERIISFFRKKTRIEFFCSSCGWNAVVEESEQEQQEQILGIG